MYDISNYNSFKVSASVAKLSIISTVDELKKLHIKETDDFVVLGEGSNVLFAGNYEGQVVVNKIESLFINELDDCAYITAGAGNNWHLFVCHMSELGFHGLENLAYIPGTIGASPVQNIGAYGVEVEKFIDEVIAFDIRTESIVKFAHHQCKFSYRNSNFKKTEWRNRYIIVSVTFKLQKLFEPVISYKELSEAFLGKQISSDNLLNKVIEIRQNKLPNHHDIPNAGSFFKNPIIDKLQFDLLLENHKNIQVYPLSENQYKISAAWLIERMGFKGFNHPSGAGVYDNHSLIIVNRGNAAGSDIYDLACLIIDKVEAEFNIRLEPEVRFISS